MSDSTTIKPGDYVGFVMGMPGPDVTYAIVRSVEGNDVTCYDPFWNLDFTAEALDKPGYKGVWKASDRELDGRIGYTTSDGVPRNETYRAGLDRARPQVLM